MSAKTKVQAMLDDAEALKRDVIARAKKDNPKLTDEQLDALWKQAAHQLGL